MATNIWHQRNDFRSAEAMARRADKPQNDGPRCVTCWASSAGPGQGADALLQFRKARESGFVGAGELYARAFDALGQAAESDKTYFASTGGHNGWQGDAGVVTWIDRGDWRKAVRLRAVGQPEAEASGDTVELLRARAARPVSPAWEAGQRRGRQRVLLRVRGQVGRGRPMPHSADVDRGRLYAGYLPPRR